MNQAPLPSPVAKKNGPPAWRRRLPWLGLGLLVTLIVVGLWPRAVPVEAGSVSRGPLAVTVDEEGMTRVKLATSCRPRWRANSAGLSGKPGPWS